MYNAYLNENSYVDNYKLLSNISFMNAFIAILVVCLILMFSIFTKCKKWISEMIQQIYTFFSKLRNIISSFFIKCPSVYDTDLMGALMDKLRTNGKKIN